MGEMAFLQLCTGLLVPPPLKLSQPSQLRPETRETFGAAFLGVRRRVRALIGTTSRAL